MKYLNENNTLTIFIDGVINSNNADEVTNQIEEIRLNENHQLLIIDLENVTYVSSAGLRIFLNLKKKEKDIKIVNVNRDVYEVFEMTGFNEVINIEKAYRTVSIEGKELIGQGYMGKVYRMDEDTIIKVNYRVDSIDSIKRERELAKKAFILGVPTAISYDVVKVKEGGFGSMFELVKSDSLCNLIIKHPENLDKYIDIYSDLLKKLHEAEDYSGSLPNKKDTALDWVKDLRNYDVFSKDVLIKMQKMIEEIPDDRNVVHGDFHIKNVMMQDDEALLIDMDTLGIGHFIFELTPMFLTYIGYPSTQPGNLQSFFGITDEQGDKIFKEIVRRFFKDKSEEEIQSILDKCALLGYMWLTQKTLTFEPENKIRLNDSVEKVNKLITQIDTLVF